MVGYAIYLKKRKEKMEEWMQSLLKSRFFGVCDDHKESKKNEVNLFCIDCHKCLCQHCFSSSSHCLHQQTLQIRRYVYQDVVRICDMQKHVDCSKVQPYVLNASKVCFLNPRPIVKPQKVSTTYCKVCDRSLTDQNQYCSVACKISISGFSTDDYQCFSYPVSQFNDIRLDDSKRSSSESDDTSDDSNGDSGEDSSVTKDWYDSTDECLKPKKQIHKRKGVPHRAPLC
ncbi:hypothetical protein MKW94_027347 [Papaver nudicaule]|uniref:B box-type domain-containing protein n=1 Tax=Papaver nudicaule TaxID=74823 RepID=A0AA41VJE7_PAPNU|nr:hypothetical protein [Papaver nudicaule]